MNLWILKPGHKVKMRNGAVARVLAETEDGTSIRVEYLEPKGVPSPVWDNVNEQEVEVLLGVAHSRAWGEEVTIIVHHIPENEDSEAGFEAVTMKGVPYGVTVTGYDPIAPMNALNNLLDALRAFGFGGRAAVEDVAMIGQLDRYDIRLD